jgi:hypothetical protein
MEGTLESGNQAAREVIEASSPMETHCYPPGTPIIVEVIGTLTSPVGGLPKVGDKL